MPLFSSFSDLLPTMPVAENFSTRISQLSLSPPLEEKALRQVDTQSAGDRPAKTRQTLSQSDEKELATEVLLLRHRFTEALLCCRSFRQATLTVLQNIYLFQNRRIFFVPTHGSPDRERQDALQLFSSNPARHSLPLNRTFQHLIVSRVWARICRQLKATDQEDFFQLHHTVVKLNTVRNIYMILTLGLTHRLAGTLTDRLRKSVTHEDAVQMGSIGIGRAAYRYHHSSGIRFSTFAAPYVFKEIHRQGLAGRLIHSPPGDGQRLSEEGSVRQGLDGNGESRNWFVAGMEHIQETANCEWTERVEQEQLQTMLLAAIESHLPGINGDIIRRRYGLPPYQAQPQSVKAISALYQVTRGSIYQREQTALKKLKKYLPPTLFPVR